MLELARHRVKQAVQSRVQWGETDALSGKSQRMLFAFIKASVNKVNSCLID